jgi:3-hydroxybutyryl-CoA dehydrogenase
MRPLTLMDLIGLDVSLDVMETMFTETRDQRYAPSPLLKRLVIAGQLGRKTGKGYYDYSVKPPVSVIEPVAFSTGTARVHAAVVAVVGGTKSGIVEALGAGVDGGSRSGTAELAARVATVAKAGAVLAVATTDEAPVGTIAGVTSRDGDVVGLHRPLAPRAGVIEVVATVRSDADAVATVVAVVADAGLVAVPCRDRPGHLVESIVLPHLGDAVRMVDDHYATTADVDTAMRLGCGYTAGPFGLLDGVGADNLRSRLIHLAAATHKPSLAPAPLLDELAAFEAR